MNIPEVRLKKNIFCQNINFGKYNLTIINCIPSLMRRCGVDLNPHPSPPPRRGDCPFPVEGRLGWVLISPRGAHCS